MQEYFLILLCEIWCFEWDSKNLNAQPYCKIVWITLINPTISIDETLGLLYKAKKDGASRPAVKNQKRKIEM